MLREQHFDSVPVFFSYAADVGLFLGTGKGLICAGFYGKLGRQAGLMNIALQFGKLRRTLAWGQNGWFLLVHEPEPMVCEVKWGYVANVREEYLKLCSQAFVSSNHVSAFE